MSGHDQGGRGGPARGRPPQQQPPVQQPAQQQAPLQPPQIFPPLPLLPQQPPQQQAPVQPQWGRAQPGVQRPQGEQPRQDGRGAVARGAQLPVQRPAQQQAPLQPPQPLPPQQPAAQPQAAVPQVANAVHVPVAPLPMAPVQGGLLGLDAQVPQVQRRWSVNVMAALSLNSNASRDRVAASTIATAARIDEVSFRQDQGANCAASLQSGIQPADDLAYLGLITALNAFEQAPLPRGEAITKTLRDAATDAVADPAVQGDLRCLAAVNAILKQLRSYDLRDETLAMGRPADWTSAQATKASAAKVELDLLSIANPQAEPLPNGSGVNSAFWIKKQGGTGAEQRSFICKPMAHKSAIDGITAGGEVAREAMSARTAQTLTRMTGIPIPIPETHVIALDPGVFPGNVDPGPSGKVTTSVQEVRPCQGSTRDMTLAKMAQIPAAQCQAVMMADMIMLNVDRHGDNVLIDGTDLVPIDHGGTFPDPKVRGALGHITKTMGTSHNCLIQMPGSHEAIPQHTLNNMKQIDPEVLTAELQQSRDEIARTTPDAMAVQPNNGSGRPNDPPVEVMSKDAVQAVGRSARFVKIAAEFTGISAASMQIAMASNATLLFDPAITLRNFEIIARTALKKALAEQEVTREACLLNNQEAETVNNDLYKYGWATRPRGYPPCNGIDGDPALALKLAMYGIARNKEIKHDVVPGRKYNDGDLKTLLTKFPRYGKMIENKTILAEALKLEIACCLELQTCNQVELSDIERFGMLGNSPRTPSGTLAAVKQLRAARLAVKRAEQESGGLDGIKRQLIAFKMRTGTLLLTMVRGPLKAFHDGALVAAFRTNDLDTISAAINNLADLVRNTMGTEVRGLFQTQIIDHKTNDDLEYELRMSRLTDVERSLEKVSVNHRPDSA